jgi:hypothetical protein
MPDKPPSFQEMILRLHRFWSEQGCLILQPYDMEVGAGTFHPATTLRALSGDYSVRLGPPPPDGSAPKVTLAFEALGAARAALDALGGGMRGSFRVVPPPWATNKKPAHNTALAAGGGSLNTAPGLPPGLASLPPALPPPPQASVPLPPAILEVAALGFTPDQAALALQSTGGHVAQAIELLIAQGGADSFTPKGGGLPPPTGRRAAARGLRAVHATAADAA